MPPASRGQLTRAAILAAAAQLATVEGLEGLSIGQLASATGLSKSGLYAHFGSKEELQLATIEAARVTFVDDVIRPGLAAPLGIRRLVATCEAFLSHVERKVYPGGCFFAAATAEVGTRRGAVHDAIALQQLRWLELLELQAREAQALGELSQDLDAAQLAFEIEALLVAANVNFILFEDSAAFERARHAIRQRLGFATTEREVDSAPDNAVLERT
jgi:AcrR family transcriptional regulator